MLIIGIDPGISGALCFMEQGKIVDVIENGYMLDDKVIRFAKVVTGS